jgi:hypothetical protein
VKRRACAWCVALLVVAGRASAAELVLPDCATPPLDLGELTAALRVELTAAGIELGPTPGGTRVTLELSECSEAANEIVVTIDFVAPSHSTASLRTRLSLVDVPRENRPRTVAVAVAELVRVTQPVPAPAPPVPAPPPVPQPAAAPPRAPSPPPLPQRAGRLSYAAGARFAWLAKRQDVFAGGAAQLALDLPGGWRPRLGVSLLENSVPSAFGPVDLYVLGGTIGWDRVLSAAPLVTLGPEGSVAGVLAQGQSVFGVHEPPQAAWFASAGARLGLEVPVLGPVRLAVAADLGAAWRTAEFLAGGRRAAAFLGPQVGGTLGVVVQP